MSAEQNYSVWRSVRLVASREVSTRIRSKSFIITTVLLVAVIVLGGVVLNLAQGMISGTLNVGVTAEVSSVEPAITALAKASGQEVKVVEVAEADGRSQVQDGKLDALVIGTPEKLSVVVNETVNPQLNGVLNQVAQQAVLSAQITKLGGDPASISQDVAAAEVTVIALNPPEERDAGQIIAGLLAGILIFISLMTTGQLVAQGVVEEKTSRVVELLLATIRPWQVMAGKVIGIGLIGLIQMVVTAIAAIITMSATGLTSLTSVDVTSAAVWLVVWFLIGYTTYAVIMGGLAALVSRQEDVGSALTPVMSIMMVPYLLGVMILPADPNNTMIGAMSIVPFFSPLLMPIRIAVGVAAPWEIALSLVLALAMIPVLVWFSGKIYGRAVLRTGAKVKLSEVLRKPA